MLPNLHPASLSDAAPLNLAEQAVPGPERPNFEMHVLFGLAIVLNEIKQFQVATQYVYLLIIYS